jgi:carbamoyltransferase
MKVDGGIMYILGLGGSGHDFSACICNEYNILGYIEDERITRKKHSFYRGNMNTISKMSSAFYLCEKIGIELEDIDYVIVNNILLNDFYSKYFDKNNVISINHHLAHAFSAFYPSEYEEAAILIIDGAGDMIEDNIYETISFWRGNSEGIHNINTFLGKVVSTNIYNDACIPVENSIGGFYRVITKLLGFGLFDEGKTMGLASYGNDKYYDVMKSLISINKDGSFIISSNSYKEIINLSRNIITFQEKADFAFAAQKITNEAVLNAAIALKKISGCNNLCIAGGVALNSVANYEIYKNGLFKNIFIQPAAGDSGTAIGAALYGLNMVKSGNIYCH